MFINLEPVCPLFWGFNPPKEGFFQSKQGSFGFQVYNKSTSLPELAVGQDGISIKIPGTMEGWEEVLMESPNFA